MQIRKFWAKGYRSLADVTLNDLGSFNVFYGPNGSGKTNLIDALQAYFFLIPTAVDSAFGEGEKLSFREAGREAARWIRKDDFFARQQTNQIVLGAVIEDPITRFDGAKFNGQGVEKVEVELHFWRVRENDFNLKISHLYINGQKPGLPFSDAEVREVLRGLVPQAFSYLGPSRTLSVKPNLDSNTEARIVGTIPDAYIVKELFHAKNSADKGARARFDDLRKFMAQRLGRGEFDVLINAETGNLELREQLLPPNPLNLDIPVDNTGLGIVQLYSIIAAIKLSNGRLVALEEPEAHLHAPSLGHELRSILSEFVADQTVHQFFISTHSNLFDLDPERYFDVRLENGRTIVEPQPIRNIDRHLYEPGPTLHALEELLEIIPADKIMFRRRDGNVITAGEMLILLRSADPVALEYLRDLHMATIDVVGLRSRKGQTA